MLRRQSIVPSMLQTLNIEITEENYEHAITENSRGCLIADAIKTQYPELSDIRVDMATIRASDREAGERYIWITPPSVADMLIFFDQGWKEEQLPKKIRIRMLAKVLPITSGPAKQKKRAERNAARLAELEAKKQQGEELTSDEKRAFERLKNPKPAIERPSTRGPSEIEDKGENSYIRGGKYPRLANKNPNMLAGRHRRFGAKTAKPGIAFREAVEKAVEERLQEK